MSTDCAVLEPPACSRRVAALSRPLVVVKFGGASLATPMLVRDAARRVRALQNAGNDVVVVASARGDTTDGILSDLAELGEESDARAREADRALATGEALAAALLASALLASGVRAASVGPVEAGLIADGPHGRGILRALRGGTIRRLLADGVVPVVAGFQGVRADGEVVTLGRGSSDVTAVFIAAALSARECHLVKDVDGVYNADPSSDPTALRFDELSFDRLVALTADGAGVLHSDAAIRARCDAVPLRVYRYDAPLAGDIGTRVGAEVA